MGCVAINKSINSKQNILEQLMEWLKDQIKVSEPGRKCVPGYRLRDQERSWCKSRGKCLRSREFVAVSETVDSNQEQKPAAHSNETGVGTDVSSCKFIKINWNLMMYNIIATYQSYYYQ